MSLNRYYPGDLVTLTAEVMTGAGAPMNATTVVWTVRDPSGTLTHPTAQNSGTGVYTAQVDLTNATPGVWRYRFESTGVQTAGENTFTVEQSTVL